MSKMIRIAYELLVELEVEDGEEPGEDTEFTIHNELHDQEAFVAMCIANGDYVEDV